MYFQQRSWNEAKDLIIFLPHYGLRLHPSLQNLFGPCKCGHALTSVNLWSLVLYHSPFPHPAQGYPSVFGSSQAHPRLGTSVFIVPSARNISSPDICMADSFLYSGLSSVSNFLSLPCHFLPYHPILFIAHTMV